MKEAIWVLITLVFIAMFLVTGACSRKQADTGARLNPPTQLAAALHDGRVILSWKGTSSIAQSDYNIYQSINEKGPFQKIGSTTKTSFEVTGLKAGTIYYFQVTALLNEVAESVPAATGAISVP
jgi:fibronectin type 3 domain-containing protein